MNGNHKNRHHTPFISDSTGGGLEVTLKTTLQFFDYLYTKHNYNYSMTSRLSQDALENNKWSNYNK